MEWRVALTLQRDFHLKLIAIKDGPSFTRRVHPATFPCAPPSGKLTAVYQLHLRTAESTAVPCE